MALTGWQTVCQPCGIPFSGGRKPLGCCITPIFPLPIWAFAMDGNLVKSMKSPVWPRLIPGDNREVLGNRRKFCGIEGRYHVSMETMTSRAHKACHGATKIYLFIIIILELPTKTF